MTNSFFFRTSLATLALVCCTGLQAQSSPAAFAGGAGAGVGATAAGTTTGAAMGMANPIGDAALSGPNMLPAAARAIAAQPLPDASKAAEAARPPVRVAGPSQFQRFVQESTGRLLPMYGRELFESPQVYATNHALPVPLDYLLAPGDEVQLQVWGPLDFNASLVLDRNGQVNLPKVGVLTLAGVAVRDLEKTLRTQLGKVFSNFQANASMGRLRGIQVYVVGQAQQPGTFQLSSLSTLVNALFASGGPNVNGSMRNIELKRGGKTLVTLDLYDFIARGDKTGDLALMSGDVIVIPPVGARVAVTGAFDQAAIYELKAGTTSVGEILALGGGVPALAKTQKALLERITRESSQPRQLQEIVLDAQGLNQPLRDGDLLTLLGISPAFANAVTLQGVVAEPLRYRWFEGMKIVDLIPNLDALLVPDYYRRKNQLVQKAEMGKDPLLQKAEMGKDPLLQKAEMGKDPLLQKSEMGKDAGSNLENRIRSMAEQINWEYAVIERLDRNKLTTELISFNLGRAVMQRDPLHNLTLRSGDVVTVLSQHDFRLPQERQNRLVRVEGEVGAPGIYQAHPGETLTQLLQRVGGLTPQAYVFGVEFSRESVRTRQQANLDSLTRRIEAQAQAQANANLANRGTDMSQAQALAAQQQAQVKNQLERLKSFKSSGRLALELDPQAQTLSSLPALSLEDGDRIVVPTLPGFVSAFGSVNNENVFIYKPGKTVGDVLRSAGLTEDAEPGQIFVLRADGSVIARSDRSGLFGRNFESVSVMPGDTVVVPAQMDRENRYNFITRAVKDWTQIFANLGLGVAAINAISK